MADKEVYLTLAGLRKLETDLAYLRDVRRKEAAIIMRDALYSGGTWENPDYRASIGELAAIEGRIKALEHLMQNAQVIDGKKMATDQVRMGHWVRLYDVDTGEELEFMIVGSVEANPSEHRISHRSPVAQAILGRKAGEVVIVQAPAGQLIYKIVSIATGFAG
ncbi:MAG: transcription elongation factor GreA [Firmicutes bacterium]|nr:transcription elongation factor GreA [Bacillota bacterium]